MKPTALVVLLPLLTVPAVTPSAATNWPSFRGPSARGVADGFELPVTWDVEKGENIAWKTPIPGLAHSSPIVWGDRVFAMTAVKDEEALLKVGLYGTIESVEDDSEHEFQVLCLDRTSGEVLWTETAWSGVPAIKRHPKSSHAASTPATDGTHVVAFFGSEGLYCYDFDGGLLWKKDFGVLDSGYYVDVDAQWGFASSPVIYGDHVFVQCDVQENSFVAAFELATGKEVWRTSRDEIPGWSTPAVQVGETRSQLILNGYKHIGGYDLATGEELWKTGGGAGGDIPVPTPILSGDLVIITNAHGRAAPILAISTDAVGEFSLDSASEHLVWSQQLRRGCYMQTPLVYDGFLFCCRDNGALQCLDVRTGEVRYLGRVGGGRTGFSASPVAGDGKLYLTSELGEVHVVASGPEFKVLAVNDMGETCMASPAISAGTLFFRTRDHLVAVALKN